MRLQNYKICYKVYTDGVWNNEFYDKTFYAENEFQAVLDLGQITANDSRRDIGRATGTKVNGPDNISVDQYWSRLDIDETHCHIMNRKFDS